MVLLKVIKAKIIAIFKKLKVQKKMPTIIINIENNKDTIVIVSIHIKYQSFIFQLSTKLILT